MALPFYIYNKQSYGDICQRQTNKCHSAKSRAAADVKPLGNIVSIDLQNVTNGIYNITITTANYDRISIKFTINN